MSDRLWTWWLKVTTRQASLAKARLSHPVSVRPKGYRTGRLPASRGGRSTTPPQR